MAAVRGLFQIARGRQGGKGGIGALWVNSLIKGEAKREREGVSAASLTGSPLSHCSFTHSLTHSVSPSPSALCFTILIRL